VARKAERPAGLSCLLVLGSGSATSSNLRYIRMLASLGYVLVVLDTMAHIPADNLRHKKSVFKLDPDVHADFWSSTPVVVLGTLLLPTS